MHSSINKCTCPQNPHLRISKLWFFGLRAPKTNSCYTTLYNDGVFDLFLNTPLLFVKFFISLPQLRGATPMLRSVLARDGAGG